MISTSTCFPEAAAASSWPRPAASIIKLKSTTETKERFITRLERDRGPMSIRNVLRHRRSEGSLVAHRGDFQLFFARGKTEPDALAAPRIEQSAGDRRLPAYPAAVEIGFSYTHDPIGRLFAGRVPHRDRGAEANGVRCLRLRRHDLERLQALPELIDALIERWELAFRLRI